MWKKALLLLLAVVIVAGFLLWTTFWSSPIPEAPPFTGELPAAAPPPQMRLIRLDTGRIHRNAGVAYRGGSFGDARDFTMSAALVRHPRGDLLIDTGFGREIDAQFQLMPWLFRVLSKYERGASAAEQLDAVGYDRKNLRGILLTHAHWDHVSGVPDFPGVPVLVTAEEHRFVADGGAITAVARSFAGVTYEEYGFEGGSYLGFPRSHDVYGDGAIVVVPAPGHTPGSVVVFVTVPYGKRYAFVGDLAWQREGITKREERPWILRLAADSDAAGVREQLAHMAALAKRFPDLVLVPAHDARAFAELSGW